MLNMLGAWGVGEREEKKAKRWKGDEGGKQMIDVNGLGVGEMYSV